MRARLVRRWIVANLAGVLAASLMFAAPVAAAQVYGITQQSPNPATVDYSDLVTFRGSYTCVNGDEPDPLCPTTTQIHTATFAIRPVGGGAFTTVQTVMTTFQFTTSSSGCPTSCTRNFSVVWKAGRAPGGIVIPTGEYDVRLTTTLTPTEAVLPGGLTIDHEDSATTYGGATSGEAGAPLALAATVADQDQGMFAGTSLFLPDVNFGAFSPVSFGLYDATNTTLVAGPVTANLGGNGTTLGSPTLTPPAAGTFVLRSDYPGNAYYRASSDHDTVTVAPSTVNTPPTLQLPAPITAEATSPAGAAVSFAVSASDAEDDADPVPTCDRAPGATFPLGTTTVGCSATDGDGATASGSFTVTVVDTTAPTVEVSTLEAAGPTGWFSLASNDADPGVTVDVATADIVGVTGLACTVGGLDVGPLDPGGESFVVGDGHQAIECTAVDGAANEGTGSATLDVDQSPPASLAFVGGGLADGGAYDFGFVPDGPSGCTADGGVSGLASCVVSGYAGLVGPQSIVATATDVAGNSATASLAYAVLPWTLVGFSRPIDMAAWNSVKGGTPVQLRFEVFAGALELTTEDVVVGLAQEPLDCLTGMTQSAPTQAVSRSPLRYGGGDFAWSWLSPREPDTCWRVAVQTVDGSTMSAAFRLK